MSKPTDQHLHSAIFKLLRPIAKILLRHSVPFGAFSNLARHAYIDVAAKDFTIPGRKQSLSRISVLTGINRKDITRLQKETNPFDNNSANQFNRASRVVNGWLIDKNYLDREGRPLSLPIESKNPRVATFSKLVRKYSGDVPVRALQDELIRVGSITVDDDGCIALLAKAYVPTLDIEEKLHIFSTATTDLLNTLNNNLSDKTKVNHFQRTASYNNIPIDCLDQIRVRSGSEMQEMLLKLNNLFSEYDLDINDNLSSSGSVRAGIGMYYFEEDTPSTFEKGLSNTE